MQYIALSLLLLFIGLVGCGKDEHLNLPKRNYTGTELRTDGYWYYVSPGDTTYDVLVLYRSGIYFLLGNPSGRRDKVDDYVSMFKTNHFSSGCKRCWGIFNIYGDMLLMEQYELEGPLTPLDSYIYSGSIIDDTTFILKETKRYRTGGEHRNLDMTYHFRSFSPKPDSTNNFL